MPNGIEQLLRGIVFQATENPALTAAAAGFFAAAASGTAFALARAGQEQTPAAAAVQRDLANRQVLAPVHTRRSMLDAIRWQDQNRQSLNPLFSEISFEDFHRFQRPPQIPISIAERRLTPTAASVQGDGIAATPLALGDAQDTLEVVSSPSAFAATSRPSMLEQVSPDPLQFVNLLLKVMLLTEPSLQASPSVVQHDRIPVWGAQQGSDDRPLLYGSGHRRVINLDQYMDESELPGHSSFIHLDEAQGGHLPSSHSLESDTAQRALYDELIEKTLKLGRRGQLDDIQKQLIEKVAQETINKNPRPEQDVKDKLAISIYRVLFRSDFESKNFSELVQKITSIVPLSTIIKEGDEHQAETPDTGRRLYGALKQAVGGDLTVQQKKLITQLATKLVGDIATDVMSNKDHKIVQDNIVEKIQGFDQEGASDEIIKGKAEEIVAAFTDAWNQDAAQALGSADAQGVRGRAPLGARDEMTAEQMAKLMPKDSGSIFVAAALNGEVEVTDANNNIILESVLLSFSEGKHVVIPFESNGHWNAIYLSKAADDAITAELFEPRFREWDGHPGQSRRLDFAKKVLEGLGLSSQAELVRHHPDKPQIDDSYACGDYVVANTHKKVQEWGGTFTPEFVEALARGNQDNALRGTMLRALSGEAPGARPEIQPEPTEAQRATLAKLDEADALYERIKPALKRMSSQEYGHADKEGIRSTYQKLERLESDIQSQSPDSFNAEAKERLNKIEAYKDELKNTWNKITAVTTAFKKAEERLNSWLGSSQPEQDIITSLNHHAMQNPAGKHYEATKKLLDGHVNKLIRSQMAMVKALKESKHGQEAGNLVKLDAVMTALKTFFKQHPTHKDNASWEKLQAQVNELITLKPGRIVIPSVLGYKSQFVAPGGMATVAKREMPASHVDGTALDAVQDKLHAQVRSAGDGRDVFQSVKEYSAGRAVVETKRDGRVVNQTENDTMGKLSPENQQELALLQAKQWLDSLDFSTNKKPVVRIQGGNKDYAQKLHAALLLLSKEMGKSVEIKNYVSSGPESGFFSAKNTDFIKRHLSESTQSKAKEVAKEVKLGYRIRDKHQVSGERTLNRDQQQAMREKLAEFKTSQKGEVEKVEQDEASKDAGSSATPG